MEKDMYPVLKRYFESKGFTVKSEIHDVDIMALKDDLSILIEMKTSLNTRLMAQGLRRKGLGDLVYLSIPKPTDKVLNSQLFKDKRMILKHLEIGLILVDFNYEMATILQDPTEYPARIKHKRRAKMLKEFKERRTASNIGGSNKIKIITAYRELALLALDYMKDSPKTTKELREYTNRQKIVSILQKNYYGWFNRVERGVYEITNTGRQALKDYANIIEKLKDSND
ncbi:MAG: DUF2161 family putative PD-(D/E)XK-type phosphodiesterase [Bacillota bacterium]